MRHYRRKRRRAKWNVLRRCSWLPSDSRKSIRPPGQWLLLGCPRRTPVDSGKSRAMEHTNCKYFCRLFFSPKYGGKFCSCPRSQRCLGWRTCGGGGRWQHGTKKRNHYHPRNQPESYHGWMFRWPQRSQCDGQPDDRLFWPRANQCLHL